MFTIFCQKGILIFCFLHIDHNIKLYPWTIAEGLSKKNEKLRMSRPGPTVFRVRQSSVSLLVGRDAERRPQAQGPSEDSFHGMRDGRGGKK